MDKDFKPYVCISEKCSEPTCSFTTFRSWHDHMLEKHGLAWHQEIHPPSSWLCAVCPGTVDDFRSPQALYMHMQSTHQFTETQLEAIVHQSRITVRRRPNICPLCCFPVEESRKRQQEPPPPESIPKRARTGIDLGKYTASDGSPSQQAESDNVAKNLKLSHVEMMARHVAVHLQGLRSLTIRLISLLDSDGKSVDIGSSSGTFIEDQQEERDDISLDLSGDGSAAFTEDVTSLPEAPPDKSEWHLMEIDRDARFPGDDGILEQFRSRASMVSFFLSGTLVLTPMPLLWWRTFKINSPGSSRSAD